MSLLHIIIHIFYFHIQHIIKYTNKFIKYRTSKNNKRYFINSINTTSNNDIYTPW